MSAAPVSVSGTPDVEVLAGAKAAVEARKVADVQLLEAALEWAHRHPATEASGYAGWGEPDLHGEGVTPVAGPGAPLVAEWAPMDLAGVLGWTYEAAMVLMGAAVEMHHRLPRLWALTVRGVVPVHLARKAAEQTVDLSAEAAGYADRLLAWKHAVLTEQRISRLVDEARLWHDPDRERADEDEALAERRVDLRPGAAPATTEVWMVLDTPDALAFDRSVAAVAETLGALGEPGDLDVRRARAVGVLADPQRALDLTTATGDPYTDAERQQAAAAARNPLPATVWLHVDTADLAAAGPDALVRSDKLGPLLADRVADWLAGSRVVVRPVLDPTRIEAVDRHDPPAAMADAVRLRDPHCVFPGCRRPARACDLDHIQPYRPPGEGGPPGQTRLENLAPLCRRHHRPKTHRQWTYHRDPDGTYHWTHTPTGEQVTVQAEGPRPAPDRQHRRRASAPRPA
jgi:hypothetical protein